MNNFDQWLQQKITNGEVDELLDYQKISLQPEKSHSYPAEHLLPLFVCLGAAGKSAGKKVHHGFLFGTLSMAAYLWL